MTAADAVARLNALTDGDPERAHMLADDTVSEYLAANGAEDVAYAFVAAAERIGFWYA